MTYRSLEESYYAFDIIYQRPSDDTLWILKNHTGYDGIRHAAWFWGPYEEDPAKIDWRKHEAYAGWILQQAACVEAAEHYDYLMSLGELQDG